MYLSQIPTNLSPKTGMQSERGQGQKYIGLDLDGKKNRSPQHICPAQVFQVQKPPKLFIVGRHGARNETARVRLCGCVCVCVFFSSFLNRRRRSASETELGQPNVSFYIHGI